MINIALQLYSVRDDMANDFVGTLKKIKNMGYDGVELAGFYGNAPEYVAEVLAEIGLIPVSAHVALDDMRADMDKIISDYKAVGCKNLVIPCLKESDRVRIGDFDKTVEDISRLAERARDAGFALGYHNHTFEFEKTGDVYVLDYLYSAIPDGLLKAELDCCWILASGESPVEYIKKYSGRIPLLHLKDFVGTHETPDFAFRPVGSGVQDFKAITDAAVASGTEWFIVEQDSPTSENTALECAEMSRNYLKTIGY